MKVVNLVGVVILFLCLYSCKTDNRKAIIEIVKEWQGKEIVFPDDMVFTCLGIDTIDFNYSSSNYKILVYVDSTGCTTCKLQLLPWKELIHEIDSLTNHSVSFLFFFQPKDEREIFSLLRVSGFEYPICIDKENKINSLNHFPSHSDLRTFLLDKENRVVAIGNPLHNQFIKDFYLEEITGFQREKEAYLTEVSCSSIYDLGEFDWQEAQSVAIHLINTGVYPLVIHGVNTSCGCMTAEYDKQPVLPGHEAIVIIIYKADQPEYFEKTLTIYCNSNESEVAIKIKGMPR